MISFREYLREEFNSTSLTLYARCDIPKFNDIAEFNYKNLSHVHFYEYNGGMYCFSDLQSALNPDAERRYGEYILKFTIPGGVKNFFYTSYEAYKQAVNPNAEDGEFADNIPFIDEQLKKFNIDKKKLLMERIYPASKYIYKPSKNSYSGVRNYQDFVKYLEAAGYIPKYIKGFEYYSKEDGNAFIVFDNKAIVPLALYNTKGEKLFDISKETKEIGYKNSRKNLSIDKIQKNQRKEIKDIDLSKRNLKSLKDVFRNNSIKGYLRETPTICKSIDISHNLLKNLIGCPKIVMGHLKANNNQLVSLEGFPQKVYGRVDISNNQLVSLEDTKYDKYIWIDWFDCSNNKLTSLKGAPNECMEFACNNNKLTNLEYAPLAVDWFDCSNNKITSLKDVRIHFNPRRMDITGNYISKEEIIKFSKVHRGTIIISDFGDFQEGEKL